MQGKRLAKMQRGINIVKIGGKVVKVVKTPSYPPYRGIRGGLGSLFLPHIRVHPHQKVINPKVSHEDSKECRKDVKMVTLRMCRTV